MPFFNIFRGVKHNLPNGTKWSIQRIFIEHRGIFTLIFIFNLGCQINQGNRLIDLYRHFFMGCSWGPFPNNVINEGWLIFHNFSEIGYSRASKCRRQEVSDFISKKVVLLSLRARWNIKSNFWAVFYIYIVFFGIFYIKISLNKILM